MTTSGSECSSLQVACSACLGKLDEVLKELRRRAEESKRMDELLRVIGVAHGRSREETIELQKQNAAEREEYQALQDAYRRTVGRTGAAAALARQCLVDGFPVTESFSDEFEALMIRYGKREVLPDIFLLKVQGLIRRASELIFPDTITKTVSASKAEMESSHGIDSRVENQRAVRRPDVETSRERIALYDQLSTELATIHQEVKKYTTMEQLRTKYPGLRLWEILSEPEQRELLAGGFKPRAYAGHLTIRNYGLTSLSTLKKDRKKLRDAQERPAVP